MANIKNNAASQETRRKLIAAAGHIFAQKGLYAATLQEITELAGTNKASVNYHFRDKFELYAAVVRYALTFHDQYTPLASQDSKLSPADQLRFYIRQTIKSLLDDAQPPWRMTIVSHELAQPTQALEAVMTELIEPRCSVLPQIIRGILGPQASEEQITRAAFSVIAQCIFYLHHQTIIQRMYPSLGNERQNVDKIVAHISEFSLDALAAARRRIARKPRR